jgi:hypothetical protein
MNKGLIGNILIAVGVIMMIAGFSDFSLIQLFWGGAFLLFGSRLKNTAKALPAGQQNRPQMGPANQNFEVTDDMIVRLAKRLGGRLSVEDLSSQTSLNREKAKERLEALNIKGVCNIRLDDIDENGRIYYYF